MATNSAPETKGRGRGGGEGGRRGSIGRGPQTPPPLPPEEQRPGFQSGIEGRVGNESDKRERAVVAPEGPADVGGAEGGAPSPASVPRVRGVHRWLLPHLDTSLSNGPPSLLTEVGRRENWFVPLKDLRVDPEPFAAGQFAHILRARFRGTPVCVKRLKRPKELKDAMDLQREVAIWSRLRHPSVLAFLGATYSADGGVQVVMEEMSGGDLRQRVKSGGGGGGGGVRQADAVRIALSVAQALAYLHGQEPAILHRDVKPENILLDSAGKARLADFGLARVAASSQGEKATELDEKYGMTGRTGTFRWMAPELFCEQPRYDGGVDVYSLGLTLYYACSGSLPFAGMGRGDREEFGKKRADFKVPNTVANVKEVVVEIVEDCTKGNPSSRPSAADLIGSLEALVLQQEKCLIS
mmetsp:Transcript_33160/g.80568  ORF Transcript_33160/g.80568 Transcript_33160/m.80568 type:complete len:411 (-) Transcript_33160:64-1296(-)